MFEDTNCVFSSSLSGLRAACMWPARTKNPLALAMLKIYYWSMGGILTGVTLGLTLKVIGEKSIIVESEAICLITLTLTSLDRMLYYVGHHDELEALMKKAIQFAKDSPPDWHKWSPSLSRAYYLSGMAAAVIWFAVPVLNYWAGYPLVLPMKIHTVGPQTGWWFAFQYFVCSAAIEIVSLVYLTADSFFFILIHAGNGSIQNLRGKLRNMKQVTPADDHKRHNYLKECIKQHQEIMRYLRLLEGSYRSPVLADVLHAVLSLSFGILALSETIIFLDWLKMTLFVIVCVWHQFLNSYFGEQLVQQQEKLFTDILQIPWYECSVHFRKTYYIMVSASKTPIKLSAWTMYYLEYKGFAEFSKNVLSYFMVLHQVIDTKV